MRLAKQRSVYCTPAQKAKIKERARARKMPVSRFLIACALEGAADEHGAHRLVVTEQEQRMLCERVALFDSVSAAMLQALPGTDMSMFGALSVLHAAWAEPHEGS